MMWRLSLLALLVGLSATADDVGLRSYEKTLFKLVRSRCTHCHDGRQKDDGISGPGFAVADLATSYARIRKYVRFDDVAESYLVKRGGNLHCLKTYGFDCATKGEELRTAIQAWWEAGEKSSAATFVDSAPEKLPVPSETSSKEFTVVTWDLSQATGDAGLKLEMEMQVFQESKGEMKGAYRFRKPRLRGASGAYAVKGVKFVLNGKEQTWANSFHSVDKVINGAAVLSPAVAIVLQEKTEGDEMRVRFDGLSRTEEEKCHDREGFEKEILAVMKVRDCFACHGGGPDRHAGESQAKAAWDMAVSDEELCVDVKQRCDGKNARQSAFVYYALKGIHRHPRIIPFAYELEPEFSQWVAREMAGGNGSSARAEAPPLVEE